MLERRRASVDPAYFLSFASAPDERKGVTFGFEHLSGEGPDANTEPGGGWLWQRDYLLWMHRNSRTATLKARQLGVTWLSCGYVLWTALFMPGSLSLVYRQKEEEAQENLQRVWHLFQSLPEHLKNGVIVDKPQRGSIPTEEIRFIFPSGMVSRILAMTSASASGHGKTAAVVLLDEFSRIDRADQIWKAVQPAAGSTGRVIVISTANGVSNPETGEGNHFHWLWTNSEELGFETRFLGWSRHPDRDQVWYDTNPEVRSLKSHERAEQYPSNPDEAFTLTQRNYFEPEDLEFYTRNIAPFLRKFDFVTSEFGRAKAKDSKSGLVTVYAYPKNDGLYAIGADPATGTGLDYSAAYVIDLHTMEFVAEFRGRLDPDLFAQQLHYLGKWYNDARIAIERGGGYHLPVVTALRDGKDGRPPYPRLYRHRASDRIEASTHKNYGYPLTTQTRIHVISQFDKAIRERVIPYLPSRLLSECYTFVWANTNPSPRAAEGCNDDCVLAASIAIEMYRMYGEHPDKYFFDRIRLDPEDNVKTQRKWFERRYLKEPV